MAGAAALWAAAAVLAAWAGVAFLGWRLRLEGRLGGLLGRRGLFFLGGLLLLDGLLGRARLGLLLRLGRLGGGRLFGGAALPLAGAAVAAAAAALFLLGLGSPLGLVLVGG